MNKQQLSVDVCNERDTWDSAVNEFEGNPLQLWAWGTFKSRHRWEAQRVLVRDNGGKVVGGAQILWRKLPANLGYFAHLPRGPFGNFDGADQFAAICDAIANWCRSNRRVIAVSAEPDLTRDEVSFSSKWRRAEKTILPEETMILDLTTPAEDLLAQMPKKARYDIRKADRTAELEFRPVLTQSEFEQCIEVHRETSARASFGIHADGYYRDAFTTLGDPVAPVWAAFYQDKVVAFSFLTHSAHTSYELYGGMNEAGKRLSANYGLKWTIIQEMQRRGVKRYDFGGIIAGGVGSFKKNWGHGETTLIGTWDLPGTGYWIWTSMLPTLQAIARKLRK